MSDQFSTHNVASQQNISCEDAAPEVADRSSGSCHRCTSHDQYALLQTQLSQANKLALTRSPAGIPDQSSTAAYSITPGGASLAPKSYSFTFTVTEPTTVWQAPAFATSSPLPACTDTMCPALNSATCVDGAGVVYGVLCDTQFSGVVITNSGKKFLLEWAGRREVVDEDDELEKRDYTGERALRADKILS